VVAVRGVLTLNLAALVALLAALDVTVELSVRAWCVGVTCGVVVCAWVGRGLARAGAEALGPANTVTFARATMTCGLAALVAESLLGETALVPLLALAVASLALDAVDGSVARRTHTASAFGARFDGETDAFLILVLSAFVAQSFGVWVLAIGAARYAFGIAGWATSWLRQQLPARYWRKVVAAIQGIALIIAAADVAPRPPTYAALAVALALLGESFGRDVLWLWRRRSVGRPDDIRAAAGQARLDLP